MKTTWTQRCCGSKKKKSVTSSYHCKFLINSIWLHDITTIISAIHQTVQSENAFEQGHLRIQREPVMCIKLIFSFLSSFAAFEKSQHVAHVAWWKRMKTGRLKNNTELKHCSQWMPGPLQNMRSSVMTIEAYCHFQRPTTMKMIFKTDVFFCCLCQEVLCFILYIHRATRSISQIRLGEITRKVKLCPAAKKMSGVPCLFL